MLVNYPSVASPIASFTYLTASNIDNQAAYKVEHQSVGISTGAGVAGKRKSMRRRRPMLRKNSYALT
ncbi:hypothetical protein [Rosenbergiella epipactidis]|uniref:hypothetical protein n=1 Tax=Rosenbergiella epipactidis TaxID=1544694 RepID=UPI001F4EB797|nr:hypothetical protein [Rosenbergiella epipactidis]